VTNRIVPSPAGLLCRCRAPPEEKWPLRPAVSGGFVLPKMQDEGADDPVVLLRPPSRGPGLSDNPRSRRQKSWSRIHSATWSSSSSSSLPCFAPGGRDKYSLCSNCRRAVAAITRTRRQRERFGVFFSDDAAAVASTYLFGAAEAKDEAARSAANQFFTASASCC
jgi:hypothetical protein